MTEQQAKEAMHRIDNLLSNARIAEPLLSRKDHLILINDLNQIQDRVILSYKLEDERKEAQEVKAE